MLKRRRIKKLKVIKNKKGISDYSHLDTPDQKMLKCECGREVKVNLTTVKVICWRCCQDLVEPPKMYMKKAPKKNTGFPPGWKIYKVFVHKDGRYFEKGKEVPKKKGKFPPTKIKPMKKRRKKKDIENEKQEKLIKKIQKQKEKERKKLKSSVRAERKKVSVKKNKIKKTLSSNKSKYW